MKKLLTLTAFLVTCFYLLTACSDDDHDNGLNANTNVVTCNGQVCTNLVSAFSGGSVSDPEIGTATRLNIFEQSYSSFPSNKKAVVTIEGLHKPSKTYKGNGDHLEHIRLGYIDKYDVNVSLNQGVFEGEDDFNDQKVLVSSVTIHSYSLGETDAQGNRIGNANIHITITMDDTSVIEIKYSGKVLHDGMY